MKEIIVLQHIGCEGTGIISAALAQNQLSTRLIRSSEGEKVPGEIGAAAGLLVMGGPMGVYEEKRYPYLTDEMKLIESAVRAQKPVLGICLGSQLLAKALGAEVKKGAQKEIGWFPVQLTESAAKDRLFKNAPREFSALHWHGDVFSLPQGAERLASSALTQNQAYRFGHAAYGILFHLEITAEMLREWTKNFSEELAAEKLDGRQIESDADENLSLAHRIGSQIFAAWSHAAASPK